MLVVKFLEEICNHFMLLGNSDEKSQQGFFIDLP